MRGFSADFIVSETVEFASLQEWTMSILLQAYFKACIATLLLMTQYYSNERKLFLLTYSYKSPGNRTVTLKYSHCPASCIIRSYVIKV